MLNVTAADILKMHGSWIEAEPFTKLVAEKMKIGERQAYRKIKKAEKNGEVLRLPLPNRRVLYGLAQFGPPQFPEPKTQIEHKPVFSEGEITGIAGLSLANARYLRNYAKLYIWLKRGASPEEWPDLEK